MGTVVSRAAANTGLATCRPDDPSWLRLVHEHPAATAFHHPAWSNAISSTYGFPSYVLAQQGPDGTIVAGLPAHEVQTPFRRRRIVALPFTDHCAPLAIDGASSSSFVGALERWREVGGGHAIEVRSALPAVTAAQQKTIGTRRLIELDAEPAITFARLHRNRIQKRVRRARELGVEVSITRARAARSIFYGLHCDTRRRQGVPVQPRRFIENVWESVIEAGLGFVVIASIRSVPIATALVLSWNRHLIYKFGASDRAHWNLGANYLVHWTAMEWGCANGYLDYDFGRTDTEHESLREFKSAWGGCEVPLIYSYLGSPGPRRAGGRGSSALAYMIKRSPMLIGRGVGELLYRYTA
jgi:CelD/BcsL family acetyltransferase involved in cellulose biosynthesis